MDVEAMKRLSGELVRMSEQIAELAEHEEREREPPLGVLMRRTAEKIISEARKRPNVRWFEVAGDWMLALVIDVATGRVEGETYNKRLGEAFVLLGEGHTVANRNHLHRWERLFPMLERLRTTLRTLAAPLAADGASAPESAEKALPSATASAESAA